MDDFTENSDNLGSTEVIVSVGVLLTTTEDVSGNLSVSWKIITRIMYSDVIISQLTNDFLNVVDNIINVNMETLQESQESSNTSAK